ncbi:MAG: hypothetical protein ACOYN6_02945 [Ignavibacteria bacterium]
MLTAILIAATELFYIENDVNVTYTSEYTLKASKTLSKSDSKYSVVIGDSRGKCGVNADLLNPNDKDYKYLNLSEDGAIINWTLADIISNDNMPETIVIAVSPADIFGFLDSNYYYKSGNNIDIQRYLTFPFKLRNPYSVSETKINDYLKRKYRFLLGFNEISNLLIYGKISKYSSANGWTSNIRLGSYKPYSEETNIYYYQYLLLENYKNKDLIVKIKNDLENNIEQVLNKKSKIIFIRIPTSNRLRKIENEKFPWFNDYIKSLGDKYGIIYFSFNNYIYNEQFSDGSHLTYNEANKFSSMLADSISTIKQK